MGPFKVCNGYRGFELEVSNGGSWKAHSVEFNHMIFSNSYLELIKKIDKYFIDIRKNG